MRVFLRGRASQVLLWGALIVTAGSSRGSVVIEAQEPPMRWDGLIELVSARYDYPPPTSTPPNPADGPSEMTRHAVSGDGRYIVFTANAPVLGFHGPAVYIRDRRMGDTRVLVGGTVNPGSALRDAVISADGRHVAFTFCEPYMRPDQLLICDIWATDTLTYSWTPLSVGVSGEFGNGHSDQPVLSSTGRFVVFRTAATNLVDGPTPTAPQLVIRDRDRDGNGIFDEPGTERIEFVSTPDGRPGWYSGNGPSETAEVSADGRYVAFRSLATDLVSGDTNNAWDVFRHDRQARETRRVNLRPYQPGYDESPVSIDSPAISMTPDGRYIAFASVDPMLAPSAIDDYNNVSDVFVYDAAYQTVQRLDIGYGPPVAGGQVPGNGPTEWPTLSDDGRYVSVQSAATNVEVPPYPNTTHSYVIDRLTGTATRVSRKPDGTEPDRDCVRPVISGDGSLVAFVSQAFNLAPNVVTDFDRVYAAVHFEITPAEQTVPGGGGSATYEIMTQQHTLWWIDWTYWEPWMSFESSPMGTGSGTVTVKAYEPNPNAARRSATIRFFEKSVVFTQLEGLSLTSVSPASGPDTGGTQVTIRGTGFEPAMRVIFGSADAMAVEFVDSTTLIATSPAHPPETVYVAVLAAPPDYRSAWIDAAFRFTDTTPPQLWYGFNDYPNEEGWFRTDVTLYWAWWDPESPITSTSGCDMSVIGADTPGTTYTCTATSEGGTSSLSATVKRDATAPTAMITSPTFSLYDLGEVVQPAFTCSDALSGVASCEGSTNGQPIDTSTPGYHTFSAWGTDRAGNPGAASIDYAVGSGVCTPGLPDNLGWWRMESNTLNTRSNSTSAATRVGLTSDVYVDAVVGQGYQFEGANGYLQTPFGYNFLGGIKKWGMAAWVKPSANTLGTIVRRREGYSLARTVNGNIAWAFRKTEPSGLSYVDTGVKLPLNVWSHVVVVLDGTEVKTYLNGRLVHTETNIGIVYATGSYTVTIGGADDRPDYFKGVIDEVQLFQNGLNAAQVEQLFLSGNAGACVPKKTTFQIVEPIPAAFGSPTYAFDVRLVDEDGMPVVGRTVELLSQVGAWPYSSSYARPVTDSDGRVHWDAPLKNAPRGLYEEFTGVTFFGDAEYVRQYTEPDVLVGKGNPVITWPALAPITYSFPINSTQLNATASVPGTFSYSPPSGTLLLAGEQTLSVTFTPNDTANYNTVTATNTLTVNKATPNVVIEGAGTWAYSGGPRAVVGKVKDRFNIVIATPTVTYNGSPDPPVMPGTYTVVATFPGNDNYLPGSATDTLTITKSVVDIWINAQDVTYNGSPFAVGYLISGLYPDIFPADSVTYNGSENSPVNAGTYTVAVTFNGTDVYEAATASKTFTIHKATPTVTVTGGTFTYDATGHPATGTVTRGGVSIGSPVVTYNGASEPPVNGGTYNVVGTFAGDANHNPATGSATITINKTVPVVTVSGGTYTYDGQPHPATGFVTGVSGAPLGTPTFTYNGGAQPPVTVGTYDVIATYPGSANYEAASATTAIAIVQANPVLSWSQPQAIVYGTPLGDAQLNATANVSGTFAYSPAPGTVLNAGSSQVLTATFTPTDSANYSGGSVTATIDVSKAAPVLSWASPAAIAYGTALGGAQLNATANVPGTFAYSPAAGTVLSAGPVQTLTATFTPADSANYSSGSVTTTIDVSKATATVTVTGGTFAYDGQPHPATGSVTGLNGVSLGTPSFTYNGSAEPPVNAGSYAVVASFAGNANYEPASATATITIGQATAVLSWNQPATIVYGTPLGEAQLNATSNVPGTFAYSPAAGVVLSAGSHPLTATFTPADTANYTGGSVSTSLAVAATPLSIRANDTAKPFGAPLPVFTASAAGFVNGDSFASLSGALAFATSATAQSAVGTYPVTPSGLSSSNYVITFVAGTLSIVRGSVTVAVSTSPAPSGLNQAMTFTANVGAAAPAAGTPGGTVRFFDGSTLLGSTTLSAGGASLTTAGLAAGVHSIQATYDGDGSFLSGTGTASHTVNNAAETPSITIASNRNPSSVGQSITLTATLGMNAGPVSGTVQFYDGAALVGTSTIVSGSATFTTTAFAAGSHAITVRYLGSPSAPPVISGVFVQAVGSSGWKNRTSSATLSTSPNPSALGAPVTLTATISGSSGTPAGAVLFMVNGQVVGGPVTLTAISGSTAQATFVLPDLAGGRHVVTATYLGSSNYKGSTATVTQVVN